MIMRFQCALLAVKDVETSKKFYGTLFGQTVAMDLGWNVTFSGGFAIQQNFGWLIGQPEEAVMQKSDNMELYFEVADFEAFLKKLEAYGEIRYVTAPMTTEWKQRVVRIYDPDWHIIEIGEAMPVIAKRYLDSGMTAAETAAEIQHPLAFVEAVRDGKIPVTAD